jgi:restriction system protein
MSNGSDVPHVWIVRAGRHGEDEEASLEQGLAIIGFLSYDDLGRYGSLEDMVAAALARDPRTPRRRAEAHARQLLAFRDKIREADTVVMPLKTRRGQIAIGRVTGPYRHQEVGGVLRHTRPVEWTHPDVPRSSFAQDLLHSFGAFSTVCRIQRNDAERRVQAVLAGQPDPGPRIGVTRPDDRNDEVPSSDGAPFNLEQAAADEVTAFIRTNFPDHKMADLVDAVLRAEGFVTRCSPPGPDGGADILAGSGPLGLDPPYLCVQVKATEAPVDVKVYRELAGTMSGFKASQGLLVSWGGFKQSVVREARQDVFKIRLWDQSDLVAAVQKNYDRLDPDVQTELPLKRVWMLVHEGDEDEE